MISPLLLLCVIFAVAWIDWHLYGKKGLALLSQSPALILWVCTEVLIGCAGAYVQVDAFVSHDPWRIAFTTFVNVVGAGIGVATSGIVKWEKWPWGYALYLKWFKHE